MKRLPTEERRAERVLTLFTREELDQVDAYLQVNRAKWHNRSALIRDLVMAPVTKWAAKRA